MVDAWYHCLYYVNSTTTELTVHFTRVFSVRLYYYAKLC